MTFTGVEEHESVGSNLAVKNAKISSKIHIAPSICSHRWRIRTKTEKQLRAYARICHWSILEDGIIHPRQNGLRNTRVSTFFRVVREQRKPGDKVTNLRRQGRDRGVATSRHAQTTIPTHEENENLFIKDLHTYIKTDRKGLRRNARDRT